LPAEVTRLHADGIALRFDWFPEPWVLIHERNPEYIRSRCAPVPLPEADEGELRALWEPVHLIHDCGPLGIDPLYGSHFFIIDWSRGADDILNAFKAWLNVRHPSRRAGRPKGEGWLRNLSAYRLARVALLSQPEAIRVIKERKNVEPGAWIDALPHAQSKENWSKAVNDVEMVLHGDFIACIRRDFGQLTGVRKPG
jgi:hypothetical protein